MLINQSTNFRL